MLSLLRLEGKQTKSSNLFRNFSLFLTHLELKPQIRPYTPVVTRKTIPDSRPKRAKCIPVFRPKRRKNPTRWGGTYLSRLYKGVPPGPDTFSCCYCTRSVVQIQRSVQGRHEAPTDRLKCSGKELRQPKSLQDRDVRGSARRKEVRLGQIERH